MKLTVKMRQWLVDNCDVEEDANDETFMKAAFDAMAEGELTSEKFQELSLTKKDKQVDEFFEAMDELKSAILELSKSKESESTKETESENAEAEETDIEEKETKPQGTKKVSKGIKNRRPPSRLEKMFIDIGSSFVDDEEESVDVRVKSATEAYSDTKTALIYPETTKTGNRHPFAGERVKDFGVPLDEGSELDQALAGVWAKYQIMSVTPKFGGTPHAAFQRLSDHEKSLMAHLVENGWWDDSKTNRPSKVKGYRGGLKALIDDGTSGGLEAAPIVFDDRVIETPLLYGELFPLVNTTTIDRGRRIEGVSTDTVTGSWGGVDATPIGLFDTTSYVAAFDTTIFRWEGAIQIGLDFLSDTPIDFGAHITRQYGERLLEDLDDVIATGNGTTQPEGVTVKSGTTSVTFGGSTSIDGYESLRFGVDKAEHKGPNARTAVFCGSETSYQRVRALKVGSSDARRLFGMDHFGPNAGGYTFGGASYRINESLGNQKIFYAILGRYRMYRRKGLAIRTSTEGDELIRKNLMLIVAMARYGGQLERGAVAAKTTDAPA